MAFRLHVVLIALLTVPSARVRGDWPQLSGPGRNGVSPEKGLARGWPADGPPVLWSRPVGVGFGGPSIRDRQVFLLDRVDDEKDVLRCLDIHDGTQLWEWSNEAPGRLSYNGSRSVPTVGSESVFAVGPFGQVYCVDRESRRRRWQIDLSQAFSRQPPQFGYAQSPLLYKDTVIVCPATNDVGIIGVDQRTGDVRWKSEALGTKGYASPVLYRGGGVDGVLFITEEQVACVDPETGRTLWSFADYHPVQPVPFPTDAGDGRLFLTAADDAGSVMIHVSRRQASFEVRELFRLAEYGSQLHAPVRYRGFLYGKFFTYEQVEGTRKLVSRLMCLDLDGGIRWKTGGKPRLERGNLIIADGMIITLDGQTGELSLVETGPEGYRETARAPVLEAKDGFVISPMALSGGKLVVRDQHEIKCLDLRAR